MAQLSPSGYAKILAARQARPQTAQTQTAPKPTTGQSPSGADQTLRYAGQGVSAAKGLAGLAGITDAGSLFSGAGAALQLAQAIRQFQQGKTAQGAIGTAGAIGQGINAARDVIPNAGGYAGAIGGLAGLASIGLGAASGKITPGMITGGIQSTGSLASSLGTLGGTTAGTVAPMAVGGATSALGTGAGVAAGLSAAGAGLGAIGTTMGVGLAIKDVVNAVMSGDDRQLGPAIGSLAGMGLGAGAGAIIGTIIAPGVGTIIGAGIGLGVGGAAGGAIGGMIGQNVPHSTAVRTHALDVGKNSSQSYADGLIRAGQTGDVSAVHKALGDSYADNRIRVDLNLPKDVAAKLGVDPKTSFSKLSPNQFMGLLKAYSERQDFNRNWFVGSGDVPYLSGERKQLSVEGRGGVSMPASGLANQVSSLAHGVMGALASQLKPQLDTMPSVAPLSWEQVGQYKLSPELDYTRYETYNGMKGAPPPAHLPADYNYIKQQIAAGNSTGLMGGGQALGQQAGNWQVIQPSTGAAQGYGVGYGEYVPEQLFAQDWSETQGNIDKLKSRAEAEKMKAFGLDQYVGKENPVNPETGRTLYPTSPEDKMMREYEQYMQQWVSGNM